MFVATSLVRINRMTFKYLCCDDGSGTPVGTVLQFENVTILIDPSWVADKISYKTAVTYWSEVIPTIDLIILSEPTIESLGAYALLFYNFLSHFISRIDVYATLPISNLGRVSTIDYYVNRGIVGPFTTNEMDLDDIEKAFDFIKSLKYSQIVDLKYKFDGLTLTAFNSGSSPGGSLWCISTYEEKLIYAKRWNHTKGTLLNGATLLDNSGKPISALTRPSAIITTFDKFGASKPFKRRNREFKDLIKQLILTKSESKVPPTSTDTSSTTTNSMNNTIIIPVEITNRFLELFVIIHELIYSSNKLGQPLNIPILFISYSRGRNLTYAKSMLEWLTASLLKNWGAKDNTSPFSMGNSFHVIKVEELHKFQGPKICLVSNVDTLINEVVDKLKNSDKLNIILTESMSKINSNPESLLSKFYEKWNVSIKKDLTSKDGSTIQFKESIALTVWKNEYLRDKELDDFKTKIIERREANKRKEDQLRQELEKGADSFQMNNGNKNGTHNGIKNNTFNNNGMNNNESHNNDDDYDGDEDDEDIFLIKNRATINNQNNEIPVDMYANCKSKYKMFPFNPKREKPDDYGTIIDFTKLIPKEERDTEFEEDEMEDSNIASKDKNALARAKRKHANLEGEDINNNENEFYDIDEEDEDEYIIADVPIKRTKRGRPSKNINQNESSNENFDNIDYLDVLNNPSKRISETKTIVLDVNLIPFTLENIVDQRSATVIWPLLKSRKIILLGPPEVQNETIISNLNKKNIDVVKTGFNDKIVIDTKMKTLDISIDIELDQLLNWQKIGNGHTIAQVVGRLVKEKPKDHSNEHYHSREKLILKTLDRPSILHPTGTLSIGDVRLAELKRKLMEQDHSAEFKGEGMLVVDNEVAVRKINDGETIIDGSPSELFDTVKSMVTEMLAKV